MYNATAFKGLVVNGLKLGYIYEIRMLIQRNAGFILRMIGFILRMDVFAARSNCINRT